MLAQENSKADTTLFSSNLTACKAFSAASVREKTNTPYHRLTPTIMWLAKRATSKKLLIASQESYVFATVLLRQS